MSAKVLIIEDDASIGKLLRRTLLLEGYESDLATSGPDGLQMFADAKPTLVILDLMLPGMDGIQVCRHIREKSNVPILMLTARAAEMNLRGFITDSMYSSRARVFGRLPR